jgi:hypothetical protein
MEGAMQASQHYRNSAAECLLAAQEASQSHRRQFHLSMAISWLSLARQYEAIEHLFQETGEALNIKGAHYGHPASRNHSARTLGKPIRTSLEEFLCGDFAIEREPCENRLAASAAASPRQPFG